MNDDEILTAIVRMDAKLEAMLYKLDVVHSDLDDHETRIRSLENTQSRLLGKLTAVWVITTGAVAAVVSWVSGGY